MKLTLTVDEQKLKVQLQRYKDPHKKTKSPSTPQVLMEITIIVMKINIITTISMVLIIIAINATKILEEVTKITSNDPGDGVELLFVGAGRLSSAGRGGQADDQRGR